MTTIATLHPTFSGAPADVMAALAAGEDIVATARFKRDGVVYEIGDVVPDFGQQLNDDKLARHYEGQRQPMVAPRRRWEAQRLELERKRYQRDVVTPLEAAANRAKANALKTAHDVIALKAQLNEAVSAARLADQQSEEAAQELEAARADAP